jgi:hypothetical protein
MYVGLPFHAITTKHLTFHVSLFNSRFPTVTRPPPNLNSHCGTVFYLLDKRDVFNGTMLSSSCIQVHNTVAPTSVMEETLKGIKEIQDTSIIYQLRHFTPSIMNDVRKKENSLFSDIYI